MTMDWTRPDNIERLTKLWGDGLSASQIAKQLGTCSRNAVIGAVHRHKLPKRNPSEARPPRTRSEILRRPRPQTFPKAPQTPLPVELKAIAAMAPMDPSLSVLRLSEFTCRYPVGDPKDADFAFCGRTCETEDAYCRAHAKLCYVPVNPAKARGTNRLANWVDRASFSLAA